MKEKYTIGLDYGTLSGRGILVRCRDGKILAGAVKEYSHGVMDQVLPDGTTKLPPAWALEYPADYLEVLCEVVPAIMKAGKVDKEDVIGIGIDFTSCTMLPIDKDAVPLCEKEAYKDRRNAYAKLWKHHGAQAQADKINAYLEENGMTSLPRFGGKISPELLAPKVMEILEEDPEIYEQADEILEAGDWLTRILTGSHKRSVSMAGYKAWWNHEEGYPEEGFFRALDPAMEHFVSEKLTGEICGIGEAIGTLSAAWAQRLGLSEGIPVASAVIDSHAGVPGSGVQNGSQMMLVLGTSSVIVGLSRQPYAEKGICGAVRDAIVPGYYALESGLACVGDLFGWYVDHMVPASYEREAREKGIHIHQLLSRKAAEQKPGESGLLALDWWNGNKTPYVNANLKGTLLGMTMTTRPEEIYRALIEATAFGTRTIVELYEKNGLKAEEMIVSGGIALKNPMLMQIYADVLGKELKIADCDQAAALGSAIYAALAAGAEKGGYDSYEEAVKQMSKVKEHTYVPDMAAKKTYDSLYRLYQELGSVLGGSRGIMEKLQKV